MTRVLSGVVLAAAALAAILFLPALGLRILACVVAAVAAHEYLRLVDSNDGQIALVVLVTWWVSSGSTASVVWVPVAALLVAGANTLYSRFDVSSAVLGAFAIVYISVPLGLLAALHIRFGWRSTLLMIATVVVSDSLQYYSGRAFGRHLLAPTISPKKTIEGAIGGAIAGTLFMMFVGRLVYPERPTAWLAMVGLLMVLVGILGDLFESRLKRHANVKDSSALIPGHGGVLDRIDALLFATPVFAMALGVVR